MSCAGAAALSLDHELCTGATYHAPLPHATQRHHIRPKYLSALLGVPIVHEVTPLCGNCHGRVHHALTHLINEGLQVHRLSDGEQLLVNLAWGWWIEELI